MNTEENECRHPLRAHPRRVKERGLQAAEACAAPGRWEPAVAVAARCGVNAALPAVTLQRSRVGQPIVRLLWTATRHNPRASRGFYRRARRQQNCRGIAADLWLLVPEGHRRNLAGGKPAPAGAAPGCHAERAMPQRGIGEVFFGGRPAAPSPTPVASGRLGRQRMAGIPAHFFDAPLGHGATRHSFRGRRPLLRTCPRLMSSGVPPGRETGGRTLPRETPARERRSTLVRLRLRRPLFIAPLWSIRMAPAT